MESVDPGGPPSDAEVRRGPRNWTVWRQDDNGNRYVVSRHETRAEADSTAATMEARGHKQTYWVARSG
ncbi:hypothetical protein ABZ744_22145 [Micromonospora chersina]|uniref:hypothetical protein n=1 Tax=Micromonospora chersina TaxID=47854 RepID=UPI00340C2500